MRTRGRQSISITRIGFLWVVITFLTPLKMNYGLHPLAFLDQQLAHLAIAIEGQMRAPTALRDTSVTGWSCGRFQNPGKPSRQHK
jgi:hypothetical protein